MKNVINELLQDYKNDWMDIFRQTDSLEEMLMATYTRALQPDCFNHYKPRFVSEPKDWYERWQEYNRVSEQGKSSAWRKLEASFSGYIKAKDEAKAQNESNIRFLKEMRDFFYVRNMPIQTEKCRLRIQEFGE